TVRPREDDDRFAVVIVGREGEGVACVFGFEQIDRLGPQIAAAVAQHRDFGAGQGAALSDVGAIVEARIMKGSQVNVEPFLVVGFADALGGEVEVVEDFLAGVETVPRRFADDVGNQVAAWLMSWPGALQPLADVKFHGNPTPQGELTSLEDYAR